MGLVDNLREWRELGVHVQQKRNRIKLSATECAYQLGVDPQMVLDMESSNVFPYEEFSHQWQDLARRYLELLESSPKPFASLLLPRNDNTVDKDLYIPSYLRQKP
jgi:hypothetical protein